MIIIFYTYFDARKVKIEKQVKFEKQKRKNAKTGLYYDVV